jgi:hypothetical protein
MFDSYEGDWEAIEKDYSRCEEPRACNESDLVVEPWEIAEAVADNVDDMIFIVRNNNGDLQSYIVETAPSTDQDWIEFSNDVSGMLIDSLYTHGLDEEELRELRSEISFEVYNHPHVLMLRSIQVYWPTGKTVDEVDQMIRQQRVPPRMGAD